jgi:hypothetical protein
MASVILMCGSTKWKAYIHRAINSTPGTIRETGERGDHGQEEEADQRRNS